MGRFDEIRELTRVRVLLFLREPEAIFWVFVFPLVLAAVLGLAFLGLAVLPRIPADILPDFKKPVIMSFFSYPGLPTIDMEKSVTSRVERALTLAGHRERIESRTMPGAAMSTATISPT